MDIPAGIAAQSFMTRQAIALEVIKQSAKADQQIAGILEAAADSLPKSTIRGANVNFSA